MKIKNKSLFNSILLTSLSPITALAAACTNDNKGKKGDENVNNHEVTKKLADSKNELTRLVQRLNTETSFPEAKYDDLSKLINQFIEKMNNFNQLSDNDKKMLLNSLTNDVQSFKNRFNFVKNINVYLGVLNKIKADSNQYSNDEGFQNLLNEAQLLVESNVEKALNLSISHTEINSLSSAMAKYPADLNTKYSKFKNKYSEENREKNTVNSYINSVKNQIEYLTQIKNETLKNEISSNLNQFILKTEQPNKTSEEIKELRKEIVNIYEQNEVKINKSIQVQNASENLSVNEYSYVNYFPEYDVKSAKISLYKETNEVVPYVGLLDIIYKMNGVYQSNKFKLLSHEGNLWTFRVADQVNIKVNTDTGVFEADSPYFSRITEPLQGMDYLQFLNSKNSQTHQGKPKVTFNLKEAGLKFINKQNDLLIPLSIFNILFNSPNYYNLYFEGQYIYGVSMYVEAGRPNYETIKTNALNGASQTTKDREYNFNVLRFLLNNFYGLKDRKFKDQKWEQTITEFDKDLFLSTNTVDNNEAIMNLIYTDLKDRHSSVHSLSFYNQPELQPDVRAQNQNATWLTPYLSTLFLQNQKQEYFKSQNLDSRNSLFAAYNTTGYIIPPNFTVGSKRAIETENALSDTFILFKKSMELIEENNKKADSTKIKNIVIDLSLNGGGLSAALIKALGFLTDKPITNIQVNKLTGAFTFEEYDVDANADNNFDDLDGYGEKYKFYILSSINTFSSANIMTGIAKTNNLAEVIGHKTGGGAFSILPTTLPDGTSLSISSVEGNYTSNKAFDQVDSISELIDIEGGVEIDENRMIEYSDYYDLPYIDFLINKWQGNNIVNPHGETNPNTNPYNIPTLESQKNYIDSLFTQDTYNITLENKDAKSFVHDSYAILPTSNNNQDYSPFNIAKLRLQDLFSKLNIVNYDLSKSPSAVGMFVRGITNNQVKVQIPFFEVGRTLLSKTITININSTN
ncbi:S41 family peptidase [Mycoplasma sp. CSL7475-4]|uniref:S41 family peptidase n=1 Tax=Mycoplasma sp. CSL7475-4 TaxID=2973942 RepID=UPI00216AD054|nr:S41 family peptidase [Mycoplasma sp. CSL7475-4]MCS4537204.1 S41 family peptidase [Mycoplasma sp. CSL7475-4]